MARLRGQTAVTEMWHREWLNREHYRLCGWIWAISDIIPDDNGINLLPFPKTEEVNFSPKCPLMVMDALRGLWILPPFNLGH